MQHLKLDIPGTDGYKLKLTCEDEKGIEMYLYMVTVTDHKGFTATHFVLSRNELSASRMARCHMNCADYELSEEDDALVKHTTVRVPLSVDGWGRNKVM